MSSSASYLQMIFSLLFIHFNKCYLQHAKKTHTYTQELSCINAWLARDAKNKKRKAIKAMQYGMCNCVICRSKLVIVYLPCINKYYFPFWNHKNWNFNVAFSLCCCCCWFFSVGLWANVLSKQASTRLDCTTRFNKKSVGCATRSINSPKHCKCTLVYSVAVVRANRCWKWHSLFACLLVCIRTVINGSTD